MVTNFKDWDIILEGMDDELVTYINGELERRGWTLRELARRAKLSHSSVSMVLSEQRPATWDWCAKIARALGEPPEHLFRMAGLLDQHQVLEAEQQELLDYYSVITPDERAILMRQAKALAQYRMEQRRRNTEPTPSPDASRS